MSKTVRCPGARRSAGYTLVEMAIVLSASALVAAAGVWSYTDLFTIDQSKGTEDYLEGVHEAVVAYAVTNKTIGADVTFEAATATVTVSVPPGRPVLPCPDLDGDGIEDRHLELSVAFTLSVNNAGGDNTVLLKDAPGRCLDDRGFLPWRTLGTQGEDHWGNKYTYWVDLNFSNASFGFDQSTRASRIFKHLVTRNTVHANAYEYVPHTRLDTTTVGLYDVSMTRQALPAQGLVLRRTPLGVRLVAGEVFANSTLRYLSAQEDRRLGSMDGRNVHVFEYRGLGTLSSVAIDANRPDASVANGIAFAVVSHGGNGHGAARHRTHHVAGDDFDCNDFNETTSPDEHRNARRNYPCESSLLTQPSVPDLTHSNGTFFVRERAIRLSSEYDDIVTWMNPDSLVSRLMNDGILPVDLPPVAQI